MTSERSLDAGRAQPLVSVVVPVYNAEPYLRECLDSVLAQTHRNWECVVVENCSSDASLRIAQEYADRDDRIRVVQQEHFVSQVENYNRAVAESSPRAEYVKFVEADNWIYPECLSRMVEVAEGDPEIGIVGAYYLHGTHVAGEGIPPDRNVMTGRELCRLQLLETRYFFGSPTSVLYRARLLRQRKPCFPPSALHIEIELNYELLRTARFGWVHQILSFLRTENEGVSAASASFNPHLLSKYIAVRKFGPVFLEQEEFRILDREWSRRYWNFLGRCVVRFRSKSLWDYHRSGLRTIGVEISPYRLVLPTFKAVFELIPSSGQWIERAIRARSLRALQRAGGRPVDAEVGLGDASETDTIRGEERA